MTTGDQLPEVAARRLQATHEYVRHIFGSLITWFTFFVTINYATMGWLATKPLSPHSKPGIVSLVAALFVTQNVLGIAAALAVLAYLTQASERAAQYEAILAAPIAHFANDSCIPIAVFRRTIHLMMIALVGIAIAWIVLAFFLS